MRRFTRTSKSLLPLLALALLLLPQVAMAAAVPEAPAVAPAAQAPAVANLSTPATEGALCEAPAAAPLAPTAALVAQLGLAPESAQCRKDEDCIPVCPCLPQCDQGVCAACLWCPPGG